MITLIANLKGGSGKSTVAFNLAVWLVCRGQNVIAYDLDLQTTLCDVARVRQLEGHEPPLEVHAMRSLAPETLRKHRGEVVIDVGSTNMEAVQSVLSVADRVVIPVPPSQADVWGTQRFLRIVHAAARGANKGEVVAFVNRADTHHSVRETRETETALKRLPGLTVIPHSLGNRAMYRRSLSEGLAVFELWPNSRGAQEFHRLACALYPRLIPTTRTLMTKVTGR